MLVRVQVSAAASGAASPPDFRCIVRQPTLRLVATNDMDDHEKADDPEEASENYSGEYHPNEDPTVLQYRRGKHTMPTETSEKQLLEDARRYEETNPERAKLLKAAADEYETMNKEPARFECAVCGLGHSHGSRKHDIRDSYGVREEFVEEMLYQANCHCGVNELAVRVDFPEKHDTQMFRDVPNPEVRGKLVDRVRSAADSAPIGAQTRERIEKLRSAFEAGKTPSEAIETVPEPTGPEPEDPTGEDTIGDDDVEELEPPLEDDESEESSEAVAVSNAVAETIAQKPALVEQWQQGVRPKAPDIVTNIVDQRLGDHNYSEDEIREEALKQLQSAGSDDA